MRYLGVDIGSSSVKASLLNGNGEEWSEAIAHDGDIPGTLRAILDSHEAWEQVTAVTTGNAGRNQIRTARVIPPLAIEAGLKAIGEQPDAVVSLGGESIVVYTFDGRGLTQTAMMGDKCAAGTGEFFLQQLGRMDIPLSAIAGIPDGTRPHPLSSRCSVFMKSDCTHKLNKKECTKEEIVVSLADVMASKAAEFLSRVRVTSGKVLLIGAVTRNRFIRTFLQDKLPGLDLLTPPQGPYFEAFGAAHLASVLGTPLPGRAQLIDDSSVSFDRYPPLSAAAAMVTCLPSRRGKARSGREYVLGIDGGSTTTKAVLLDAETKEIVASHYGRTHGDPVEALRDVLTEIRAQVRAEIGDAAINISLAATTGSSREVLGVFTETAGVYNEIIAHSVGTTFHHPGIDTIFEIGGQDAKYVLLRNGVPIDYAMNEACSAGTGSFLEESARGDLNIQTAPEIGPIAMQSGGPLKFGEHCSAFINTDIRAAIQQGAEKSDIVGGIVLSIVSNYLNRVVGNRTIGNSIVLQGGVAKNPAVPAAFATVLGKEIVVPPDPELLGAFGVGLLALQKERDGLLQKASFPLDELIARQITSGRDFKCQACENLCRIRTLRVGEHKYFFGGRCNKYANIRNRRPVDHEKVDNYVAVREQILFGEFAPDSASLRRTRETTVGIPRAFTVHTLWPLFSWFFHDLGIRAILSEVNEKAGVQRAEAAFCFPGEIAHGMTQDLLNRGVDFIFMPQVKMFESLEQDVHATTCPITQGLPYFLRAAFGLDDARLLRPVMDFGKGLEGGVAAFEEMAVQLGLSAAEGRRAFNTGLAMQKEAWARMRQVGTEVLAHSREHGEIVIALLGRPYNAFAAEANMGIPRKIVTRGYKVLPFDMFPFGGEEISTNMYWYYGQTNLKAVRQIKEHPNAYLAYISNFGCAPDSFILHFIRWMMGTKPFLVLELDSHTADAGVDTRIEAFLDIIDGYRAKSGQISDRPMTIPWRVRFEGEKTSVVNTVTGEERPLKHQKVRLVWPSMGSLTTEAICAITAMQGIRSEYLPAGDYMTTQMARSVASGKECIPTLLVLGQILKLLVNRPPEEDEVLAIVVPKTTGPCRTGQYGPFYEGTFAELGIENVAIASFSSDNGYRELGADFTRLAWYSIVLGDFMTDMRLALRILAEDPKFALSEFDAVWRSIVDCMKTDVGKLFEVVEAGCTRLAAVPRRGDADSLPKVLVVGEIYVRRDDFSVDELQDHLVQNGILGKVTGIAEWMQYCAWLMEHDQKARLRRMPLWRRPFAPLLYRYLGNRATTAFAEAIERRARTIFKRTGLLPDYPHDMDAIMSMASEFTDVSFETEATVSSLVAATAARQGYSGVLVIAPFACLPGRLIKSLLDPWCRQQQVPFMAVENDGLAYPPGILQRLEVFMLNVLRKHCEAGGNGGDTASCFKVNTAKRPSAPGRAPVALKKLLKESRSRAQNGKSSSAGPRSGLPFSS